MRDKVPNCREETSLLEKAVTWTLDHLESVEPTSGDRGRKILETRDVITQYRKGRKEGGSCIHINTKSSEET